MVSSSAAHPPRNAPVPTRIVGIGASAGGLVALEQFLGQVPPKSGMAYVVVQHLDPTQKKNLLAELLQRVTTMQVIVAKTNMLVEPDSVYVISPNTELSVVNGMLNLERPAKPRGLRLPINVLFSSLAITQGERAIAVVLSGMGSDGTLGLQAIKAVGGLTVAQMPDTAEFDPMPKSAIASGFVDIVAPPAELPSRILAYIAHEHAPDIADGEESKNRMASAPMQRILWLLHRGTRHDFSSYKTGTLHRRIERRMAIHDIATMELYADFLENNSQEIELLFKELLIGVTSFFRDDAVWKTLANSALPELMARRTTEHKLRAWVVGCSTGEEAYSLAMAFTETAQRLPQPHDFTLQIFASDLSPDAIATARSGKYPASIAASVSPDRLARFFSAHGQYFQINETIRDMVIFAQHDVLLDPPFTRLDLISCRNLLIYFEMAVQRRLVSLFHYSMRPGGLLLLGSSETVGKSNHLFASIAPKLRLYLSQDNPSSVGPNFLMKSLTPLSRTTKETHVPSPKPPSQSTDNLQTAADQLLLQVYAPASVVLNNKGDIVYISGRIGKYLEPAPGKVNWNFHAMVHEGLRAPLADALQLAPSQRNPLLLRGLKVQIPGGGVQSVDVTVQSLHEPAVLENMTMIVFRDIEPTPVGRRRRKSKIEVDAFHAEELQKLLDEIHTLREESQTSKEELQSTNEELQSTNEELQSTNEELTTSKEEMQSMNEELQTVNTELQAKLDDLALAQSDMHNLLNSIDIAIVFLDRNMNVRRYTDQASKIINVRESDVGRPLSDLTSSLQYPGLYGDALETLRTLAFSEKQIPSKDGRWYTVRIIPYKRLDDVIDGVVVTFIDITATKELESARRQGANP